MNRLDERSPNEGCGWVRDKDSRWHDHHRRSLCFSPARWTISMPITRKRGRRREGGKEGRQSGFGGSSDNRHKYSRGFSDLYFARISHLICMENLVVRDAAFAPSFSTAYTYTRIPVIARTAAATTTTASSSSQTRQQKEREEAREGGRREKKPDGMRNGGKTKGNVQKI